MSDEQKDGEWQMSDLKEGYIGLLGMAYFLYALLHHC